MKIAILDGCFDGTYSEMVDKIVERIEVLGHQVSLLKIRECHIAYCTGCWDCWVKTPGICRHKDDTPKLLKTVIHSDSVIHLTQNSLGAMTSLSKKSLDKIIPLVHPHIVLYEGECHHKDRYDKYPNHGLIFIDPDHNDEDFKLVQQHLGRALINLKSEWQFGQLLTGKEEEVDELDITKWFA